MTPEMLPPDLRQVLADVAKNEADAEKVVAGLSTAQLNWRPNEGKSWSILQCLEHLRLANTRYLDAMRPVVRKSDSARCPRRGPISPSLFGRIFVGALEPPVKLKGPAPGMIQPDSTLDPERVVSAWKNTHQSIRELAISAAALDLNALEMTNPFVKQLNVNLGTAFLILAAHGRRHVWQAARVRDLLSAG